MNLDSDIPTADRVVVVTVTYGDRWQFLRQTVDAVINDPFTEKIIIVDNGSKNKDAIEAFSSEHADKIILIRNDQNVGSAGGYALGIDRARKIDAEHLLLLDDDNVVEKGGIKSFLGHLSQLGDPHAILAGNRIDIADPDQFLHKDTLEPRSGRHTFFEVFSMAKLKRFFDILFSKKSNAKEGRRSPIVPIESFAFGGTFMPLKVAQEAPLPNEKLFLYGDDIEYSWGVGKFGYKMYVCSTPIIRDVDMTFEEGSHIIGLFSKTTKDYKVYFRLRNMVIISMHYASGFLSKISLICNIAAWVTGLCVIGLFKGTNENFKWNRYALIFKAIKNGLEENYNVPEGLELPPNSKIL